MNGINCPDQIEDLDPREWLGLPTREEMLEQQCRLIESEYSDLQADLSRARQNIARLVDMHTKAESGAEALAKELAKTQKTLSTANLENSGLQQRLLFGMTRRDQMISLLKNALVEKGGDPDQVLYHYKDDLKAMET